MRRVLAGMALFAFASLAVAVVPTKTPTHPRSHGYSVVGVVIRMDVVAKTFSVQTQAGVETTLVRTSATRVQGDALKPGDRVAVRYMEKDGKKIATSVRIEPVATASVTPTAAPAGGR
jgi:hypothetical protein